MPDDQSAIPASDAKRLFATVRRVIDIGRDNGVTIVFIKDNFLPEEIPIDKHFKIYGPHCIIGTPDAEVVDAEIVPSTNGQKALSQGTKTPRAPRSRPGLRRPRRGRRASRRWPSWPSPRCSSAASSERSCWSATLTPAW